MNYAITLVLTVLLVGVALWVFVCVGTPAYRIQRHNVITLLTMVAQGNATESDWDVFLGVPIQHDQVLELVRQRCADISEREYIGGSGYLFTEAGLQQLAEVLDTLVDC